MTSGAYNAPNNTAPTTGTVSYTPTKPAVNKSQYDV